jgi:hypothetical protein
MLEVEPNVIWDDQTRHFIEQLHLAWSRNAPFSAYAVLRDGVLAQRENIDSCLYMLGTVAKIAYPTELEGDPQWHDLDVTNDTVDENDTRKRKRTSNQASRTRNLAVIAALWSLQLVQHYGWHWAGQSQIYAIRTCAIRFPDFVRDLLPRLNCVLLHRHCAAIAQGHMKTLNHAPLQPLRDLDTSVLDAAIPDEDAEAHWLTSRTGRVSVNGGCTMLSDLRPLHFHRYLLRKDRYGMLVVRGDSARPPSPVLTPDTSRSPCSSSPAVSAQCAGQARSLVARAELLSLPHLVTTREQELMTRATLEDVSLEKSGVTRHRRCSPGLSPLSSWALGHGELAFPVAEQVISHNYCVGERPSSHNNINHTSNSNARSDLASRTCLAPPGGVEILTSSQHLDPEYLDLLLENLDSGILDYPFDLLSLPPTSEASAHISPSLPSDETASHFQVQACMMTSSCVADLCTSGNDARLAVQHHNFKSSNMRPLNDSIESVGDISQALETDQWNMDMAMSTIIPQSIESRSTTRQIGEDQAIADQSQQEAWLPTFLLHPFDSSGGAAVEFHASDVESVGNIRPGAVQYSETRGNDVVACLNSTVRSSEHLHDSMEAQAMQAHAQPARSAASHVMNPTSSARDRSALASGHQCTERSSHTQPGLTSHLMGSSEEQDLTVASPTITPCHQMSIEDMLHHRHQPLIASYMLKLDIDRDRSGPAIKPDLRRQWLNSATRWAKIMVPPKSKLPPGKVRSAADADVLYYTSDEFIHVAQAGEVFSQPVVIKENFSDSGMHTVDEYARLLQDISGNYEPNMSRNVHTQPDVRPTQRPEARSPIDKDAFHASATFSQDSRNITKSHRPLLTMLSRFRILDTLVDKAVRSKQARVTSCTEFNTFRFSGSFSGAQLGTLSGTWIRILDGVQFWTIIPESAMETEWSIFAKEGNEWAPNGRERLLVLERDDVLFMPPGSRIVHAVHSPTNCLASGGLIWDELDILRTLGLIFWGCQNQTAADEANLCQLPFIIDELAVLVRARPARFCGSVSTQADWLCTLEHAVSGLRALGCHCLSQHDRELCQCRQANRRCNFWCTTHPQSGCTSFAVGVVADQNTIS